jgi:hypothetical protein
MLRRRFRDRRLLLHGEFSLAIQRLRGGPVAAGCRSFDPCYTRRFSGRARVAELVDALDLGSSIARCGGSSPSARTIRLAAIGL